MVRRHQQTRLRRVSPRRILVTGIVSVSLAAACSIWAGEPEIRFRDWTNANGETIRARLSGLINGRVQLRQLSDASIIELKLTA